MMFPPQTEEQRRREEELKVLIQQAQARYNALSPEAKEAHDKAQRESWIRGMGPCEHGDYDWETCPRCLEKYR
jgi:hypothetical protein